MGKVIFTSQAAGTESGRRHTPLVKVRGVPHGSCLGPLTFPLYTDLPNYMAHGNAHFYADDCQLHSSYELNSHNVAIGMQNIYHENIRMLSTKHRLKLNTNKCSILHIATSHGLLNLQKDNAQVFLDSEILVVCDSVRTLGVILVNKLTFSDHVTHSHALGRLQGICQRTQN